MFNRLLNSQVVLRVAQAVLGTYLAFALRSTRWQVEGGAHIDPFRADVPVIVAFWHECLPLMPAGWAELRRTNPQRRAAALISRHRDGRFNRRHHDPLCGCHRARLQRQAGRTQQGRPGQRRGRGPARHARAPGRGRGDHRHPRRAARARHVAAPGTIQLAALSGAPILPSAARLRRQLRLGTWDRMILPLPFGRGAIVCAPALRVARHDDRAAAEAQLTAALTEAATRAEALCAQTSRAA